MKRKTTIYTITSVCLFFFSTFLLVGQSISGTVFDESNEPIIGATVFEQGNETNGTITDENGQFQLDVSSINSNLVSSYVGYGTVTLPISGQNTVNFILTQGQFLDDIVVTARKKEESLQSVPISITAISGKDIERRGISDIQDVTLSTPSFSLDNFGGTKVRPAIRGLGSENTSPGQDFTTAVFLDGVFQSTNGLAAVDVYDIERVETLKGPQGALWGKGVIGGGVNFITAKPDFSNYGKLSLTGGNFGLFGLTGFANLSSSNKVAHRIAVNFRRHGGYAENVTTGENIDDLQRLSGRYSLRVKPTENFTLDFSADYTGDDSNGKNIQIWDGNQEPVNPPFWQFLVDQVGSNELGTREEFGDLESADRTVFGTRLGLDFNLNDNTNLIWITGYRQINDGFFDTYNQFSDQQIIDAIVATNTQNLGIGVAIGDETEANQITSELRVESSTNNIDWTGGVYVGREDGNQDFLVDVDLYFPVIDTITNTTTGANFVRSDRVNDIDNVSVDFGVFGQFGIDLTDALNLTVGGRFNTNSKDFGLTRFVGGAEAFTIETDDSWSAFTWNASLKYSVSEDAIVYAAAATGYKPGGFAPLATDATTALTPLDNESSTSFEIGTKLDLSEKVRLNVALFTTDFEGLQVVTIDENGDALSSNIDAATVTGAEAELFFSPVKGLYSEVRYAYLNTDVDGFLGEDDLRLNRVPENEITVNLRYRASLNKGALEFSGLYSYRGEMYDNPSNSLLEVRPAVGLLDAYVAYETSDLSWGVKLWGKNITNENYSLNSFGQGGAYSVLLAPPATVGITLTKYFN